MWVQDIAASEALARLRSLLLAAQNADGGWGFHHGKRSRVEPTAWALLAVGRGSSPSEQESVRSAVEYLHGIQQGSGLLDCGSSAFPNLSFNGLAAVALLHLLERPQSRGAVKILLPRLLAGIAGVKGSKLPTLQRMTTWLVPSRRISTQNDDLQGWPWLPGTFTWVEPTAWCLLALKKAARAGFVTPDSPARIREAEQVLLDRYCDGGGWNYGNANMLGRSLHAYVPTTALGLLALQDRMATPAVRISADFLARKGVSEASGTALGLATIALRTCGVAADGPLVALVNHLSQEDLMGNNMVRAIAMCALTGGPRAANAFAI